MFAVPVARKLYRDSCPWVGAGAIHGAEVGGRSASAVEVTLAHSRAVCPAAYDHDPLHVQKHENLFVVVVWGNATENLKKGVHRVGRPPGKQLQEAGALTYVVANDEIHLPEPEVVSDFEDSD